MNFFLCFILLAQFFSTNQIINNNNNNVVKICVLREKFENCLLLKSFAKELNIPLECVSAKDRIECIHKIANGEAFVVNMPANEAYAATTHFPTFLPLMEEKTSSDGEFMYESVAVVRKDIQIKSLDDLKGKKSCHTGYRRTAGWDIPIGFLSAKGILPSVCTSELDAVSRFFDKSCIPGNWSRNAQLDARLKKSFPNVCELCSAKCNSSSSESYLGYEGALKCLTENSADIAFTKYKVALNFSQRVVNFSSNYRLLCPNGTLNLITQLCDWGARPNPLLIAHQSLSDSNRNFTRAQISRLLADKPWPPSVEGTLLQNKNSFQLVNVNKTIQQHLIRANFSITMDKPSPCSEKYLRVCVTSEIEKQKCLDWKAAVFSKRIRPQLECKISSDCTGQVERKEADLLVADPYFVYDGINNHGLKSILSEFFVKRDSNYYLVAVIQKVSTITRLADLKGRNSCHAKFSNDINWSIVKGKLKKHNIIKGKACELDKLMSKFFKSSCVPGADAKSLPELCALCKDKTNCSLNDEFAGFKGAKRCLTEGGGEVAFLSHWEAIKMNDSYELLCLTNERKPVENYISCNWGAVPGKQVLTSQENFKDSSSEESLLTSLMESDYFFNSNSSTFKLYLDYNNTSSIFTNATGGLNPKVTSNSTQALGKNIDEVLRLTECKSGAGITRNQITLLLFLIFFCTLV